MDFINCDYSAMISYDYKKGITANKCSTGLTQAFKGPSPSRATVSNSFRKFRMGRQSLEDETRTGSPHTSVMTVKRGCA